MNSYKDDENKKILRITVLNGTIVVLLLVLAFLFAQIGNYYERQPAFATDEVSSTDGVSGESENPTETNSPVATDAPVSTPEETTLPDDTESVDETTDPEESLLPDVTETPVVTEPGITQSPEETYVIVPTVENSSTPDITMTPGIVTPSPTLAGIEEPIVSGNVIIDVEENDSSSTVPYATFGSLPDNIEELLDPTPTPIRAVDDIGNLSAFFGVMVYVFVVCAILTALYGVFITVKMLLNKKNKQNDTSKSKKEE